MQHGVIGKEIAVMYTKSQQLHRQEDRETRRFVLSLSSESNATKARATEVAREFLNLDNDRVIDQARAMNMFCVQYWLFLVSIVHFYSLICRLIIICLYFCLYNLVFLCLDVDFLIFVLTCCASLLILQFQHQTWTFQNCYLFRCG